MDEHRGDIRGLGVAGDRVRQDEKLCPVILRSGMAGVEILVFRHPTAGVQLVKGTREGNEPGETGALRELAEEAGLVAASVSASLGSSSDIVPRQVWHFYRVEAGSLPESWTFDTADDGGRRFAFFWWPLHLEPDHDWHKSFVRALHYIRSVS